MVSIRKATPEELAAAQAVNEKRAKTWAESEQAVRKDEAERTKRLFGDQKPFLVPDEPY